MTQKAHHTPGPWKACKDLAIRSTHTYRTICRAHKGASLDSAESEAKANAHLIAATPELLEALRPFAKAYTSWHGGNAAEYFSLAVSPGDFLRAAEVVAKAELAA